MSDRFQGRTAFITGAGRGQGRSHALAFAKEGANLALIDICKEVDGIPIPMSSKEDLDTTVRLCEEQGAKVVSGEVDVRDYDELSGFKDQALEELGAIDILCANAGIFGSFGRLIELTESEWQDMIDVNLTGVWKTVKAVVPSMAEKQYGRVIITGSGASLAGYPHVGHYVAAKHGVLGITRVLALEHAADGITANCICPANVNTPMVDNPITFGMHNPDNPTFEGAKDSMTGFHAIPVPWVEPEEISAMVVFLALESNAHITGTEMKVDAGFMVK
ncbi:MAG: mycofactocin-coupled SDR family oxidoreductase [Solirubrobacterales bacterium]